MAIVRDSGLSRGINILNQYFVFIRVAYHDASFIRLIRKFNPLKAACQQHAAAMAAEAKDKRWTAATTATKYATGSSGSKERVSY
jgi:hypothetical protein